MRNQERSSLRGEEVKEDTQDGVGARSRRMLLDEKGRQEMDRLTMGEGQHASTKEGIHRGGGRIGEGEATL